MVRPHRAFGAIEDHTVTGCVPFSSQVDRGAFAYPGSCSPWRVPRIRSESGGFGQCEAHCQVARHDKMSAFCQLPGLRSRIRRTTSATPA